MFKNNEKLLKHNSNNSQALSKNSLFKIAYEKIGVTIIQIKKLVMLSKIPVNLLKFSISRSSVLKM